MVTFGLGFTKAAKAEKFCPSYQAPQRPPVARVAPQREAPKLTVPQALALQSGGPVFHVVFGFFVLGQALGVRFTKLWVSVPNCAKLHLLPRRDLLQGFSDADFQSKRKACSSWSDFRVLEWR